VQLIEIEKEARRLQYEIWTSSDFLWEFGKPSRIEQMFTPEVAARVCHLNYEPVGGVAANEWNKFASAGTLDRDRGTIRVSTQFGYTTQRFTGAHEIGHFLLHPQLGSGGVIHRDRPISGSVSNWRPLVEVEADYFAACFLMPRKLVIQAYEDRFGSRKPPQKTEAVLYHLFKRDMNTYFSAPRGSKIFARAVASTTAFDTKRFPSLADQFGVSPDALAIRLEELGLVAD
jgi:Zn-dependent peptidase ImmA (M78 family)